MLSHGASLRDTNDADESILQLVCRKEYDSLVKLFLTHKPEIVNTRGRHNRTALEYTLDRSIPIRITQLLLLHGANYSDSTYKLGGNYLELKMKWPLYMYLYCFSQIDCRIQSDAIEMLKEAIILTMT